MIEIHVLGAEQADQSQAPIWCLRVQQQLWEPSVRTIFDRDCLIDGLETLQPRQAVHHVVVIAQLGGAFQMRDAGQLQAVSEIVEVVLVRDLGRRDR